MDKMVSIENNSQNDVWEFEFNGRMFNLVSGQRLDLPESKAKELVDQYPFLTIVDSGSSTTVSTNEFKCDECKQSFVNSKGLKLHITRKHQYEKAQVAG